MTSIKTLRIETIWTCPQVHPYTMHWLGLFIAFQSWRSKLLASRKSVKGLINHPPQESSADLSHTYKSFHQFDSINHYCLKGKEIKHVEALSIIKWIFPITRKLNATLTLSWKLIPSISINQFLLRADFNHYLWQFRVFNIWPGNVHSTNQFPQANILVFRC